MCVDPLKKICHWGPLTALGIIKIITLMTIHCSRQWWPPQESFFGAVNFILFFCLSGSTLFHFISAIYEGPGFLPLKWIPEKATDTQYLQYCSVCEGYKAPRSHHCRKCARCVMKMDHHCPWINNCVGHYNHCHFTAFLASAVAGCCVSTFTLVSWVMTVLSLKPLSFPPPSIFILILVIFSIGLSIGVILAVGTLLYFQLLSIIKNTTEIEAWISEKAHYRRFGTRDKFIYPYSKGWRFNLQQVFTWDCTPIGDGIHWPVIEGCDQYTLTREQLAQKKDKRKRAKTYRVIEEASGSRLPLKHGWGVLCHPPCTDEPRIKLKVGDIVIVTRWRKYWLFGEKKENDENSKQIRNRGWFPRPCAIEVIENEVYPCAIEVIEQMSALPPDEREKFLNEQFSDLPSEHRAKWLQIASLTPEEREVQRQQLIREQYSALKTEDKERLFKENFPELPIDQRQKFEKVLLSDWKEKKNEKRNSLKGEEEIFDMDGINDDESCPTASTPKSFVAVTSSERIRKISVVKNDFRPITEDMQSSGREKSSDESNASMSKKNSKDESVEENKNNSNSTKRKRKRKSILRKKGSQRKSSNGSSSQTEISENDASIPDESFGESMVKDSNSTAELENKNESVISTQETTEKRPETDFHFFSDTEVTKNQDSRPCSPVQSDTEFEMRKITQEDTEREDDKSHQQSWRWGELPSLPPDSTHTPHRNSLNSSKAVNQPNSMEAHRSMLSGMLSFMRKTSRVRRNPELEGIYLSDLNADELDPEVAALYFPSSHRGQSTIKDGKGIDEEDTESGNGPSLPQSPNSVEGAIGGPKSLDSDFEEPKHSIFDNNMNISISLCGGLDSETGPSKEVFHQNLLHFEDICSDPKLYENPNLVVKINEKFYNWTTACSIIMTYAVFQRHLPQNTIENLYTQCMPLPMHEQKKQESAGKPEGRSGYSSWFSWRRSTTQPPKKSQELNQTDGTVIQSSEQIVEMKESTPIDEISNRELKIDQNIECITETVEQCTKLTKDIAKTEKNREREGEGYSGSEDSDSNQNESQGVKIPKERRSYYESTEKYRKTLRLSSIQIASLNLKDGANEVVFSVTTAYQGTTRCKCHIYKWKWDDKIVISDIDGTITKSDVLGHILPIVGKDWAQSGVAQLFTKIKNNGYKLLYLSARAIGQAKVTREYLKSIRQGDLSLPDGPLLLNPTSLISAFHREVIERKPEEFKISCLSDIQALFPEGSKPFYAGYGNRINDVWAYRAVGIPTMRIFTINHRGELKHELTQTFQSSYSNMSFIVDHLFPAWREDAADEFSNFVYWRDPIPEVPSLEELYTQRQIT